MSKETCTAWNCAHEKTAAGHCNKMSCDNHWDICPEHSGS